MLYRKSISVQEAVNMYLDDRAKYYDSGDGPTRAYNNIKSGLNPLVELVGDLPLRKLDAPTLAWVRDQWIHEAKVSGGYINRRLRFVSGLMKWAIERGYTKAHQLTGINAVERIKNGRYGTKPKSPVRPADRGDVLQVLNDEKLSPTIRSMMELVQLTGMRPGEARIMKLSDLERIQHKGETVFRYTITKHKTAHHGKRRRVFITGRAYQIIIERISSLSGESLFDPETEGFLFSPDGKGSKPYAESSVPQAIRRARKRSGIDRWTPNQLRHGFATETRAKGYQLDLIADLLGHADPRTTLIYAEPDDDAAMDAMVRLAV